MVAANWLVTTEFGSPTGGARFGSVWNVNTQTELIQHCTAVTYFQDCWTTSSGDFYEHERAGHGLRHAHDGAHIQTAPCAVLVHVRSADMPARPYPLCSAQFYKPGWSVGNIQVLLRQFLGFYLLQVAFANHYSNSAESASFRSPDGNGWQLLEPVIGLQSSAAVDCRPANGDRLQQPPPEWDGLADR